MRTLASQFHLLTYDSLIQSGFSLANDPNITTGMHSDSRAMYRFKNKPLYLKFGFQPGDSNTAVVSFGREWVIMGRHLGLSNTFAALANLYNFNVPEYYKLGYGDESQIILKKIFNDLIISLAEVVQKVTIEDLIKIESIDGGMLILAKAYYGEDYLEHISVSCN